MGADEAASQASPARVIRAKIRPPLTEGWVARARPEALLAGALESRRVVVVSATAGSGKTTLVEAVTHRLERPVAWLTLDWTDTAPGRLVTYLEEALSMAVPRVRGVARDALTARVRIAPEVDYLERAFDHSKYGRYSTEPYIEFTIPSLLDSSLAPNGAHVLSAYVQFAPYRLRDTSWDHEKDGLARAAIDTLERYAPALRSLIVEQRVLTPLDLERTYGFTGGHIFHGELALDQMLSMRPLLGWGHYRTPIKALYLCSSGTHPGTGFTGGSGANAAREVVRDLR